MTESLQSELLATARSLPAGELPQFLGALAMVQAVAQQRLLAPVQNVSDSADDCWLDIEQAREMLGLSKSYLYVHDFPFKRREGRAVRFSKNGILQYINQRRKN